LFAEKRPAEMFEVLRSEPLPLNVDDTQEEAE